MKWSTLVELVIALIVAVLLSSCGTQPLPDAEPAKPGAPVQNNDLPTPGLAVIGQDGTYLAYGVYQPLDLYTITAEVMAAPGAVTNYNVEGSGSYYRGTGSSYISGGTSGKGIVRIRVKAISVSNAYVEKGLVRRDENWKPLAAVGDYVIIKVEDTRGSGWMEGDTVEIKCREQWEIVGAVGINEIPFLRNVSREFDLCRMSDGHYTPAVTTIVSPTLGR